MLEVNNLVFGYGNILAVQGVSLQVHQGEAVAIIGANGAGKTTLVRLVSGVLKAAAGDIRLDGHSIVGLSPYQIARLGVMQVPEGRHLFPAQSVRTNLLLGGYHRSPAARRLERDLQEIHELFPVLRDRGEQVAGTLSGGEQQMVAIGRALMGKPRLLILDEPTMGLAPKVVEQILAALRLLKSQGLSLLLVEQNARLALELTNRGYVMQGGRILLEGPSDHLRIDPTVKAIYLGRSPAATVVPWT